MEREKKIVIAGENKEFCEPCEAAFKELGYQTIFCPRDGLQVLKAIRENTPSAVLIDVFMSSIDAFGVMDEISKWEGKQKPKVFTYSSMDHSSLPGELMSRGSVYHFMLPFDPDVMAERIDRCVGFYPPLTRHRETPRTSSGASLEAVVTGILLEIGVPAHIKGYQYVRDAIVYAVRDKTVLNGVTKILYPAVAKANDTTPSRVERAIRHGIEVAWDRGDVEVLNSYFGYTIHNLRGKPTNSEFIAMISDKIRIDRKERGLDV